MIAIGIACLLIALSLLPLLVLVGKIVGFTDTEQTLWQFFVAILSDEANQVALAATLRTSLGATVLAALWGAVLALLVERTDVPARRLLGVLGALPLAVPPYLLAMATTALWAPRSGLLPLPFPVAGEWGIAWVMGFSFSPYVLVRLRAALSALDPATEEAARASGASAWRALWTASQPAIFPALAIGTSLSFVAAAASFGVPALLGLSANPRVFVLTTRISAALQVGSAASQQQAFILSMLLAFVAALAFLLPYTVPKRFRVSLPRGKSSRPAIIHLGKARIPTGIVLWGIWLISVGLPLVALVLQSFILRQGDGINLDNMGLTHFINVLSRHTVPGATMRSILWSAVAAFACLGVGLSVALAKRAAQAPMTRKFLQWATQIAEIPAALPGTVVAVALTLSFTADIYFILADTVSFILAVGSMGLILVVSYLIKSAAYALRGIGDAVDQLDKSLEESARIMGANRRQAFTDAALPLLLPALGASFVVIFLPLLPELTMSVLLVEAGKPTWGTLLFELNDYGSPQEAAALAAVLIVVVVILQIVLARLQRK